MRLFVSGATSTIREHRSSPYLGHLIVPHAGNRLRSVLAAGLPWAADNAAFSGFDPAAYSLLLGRIAAVPGCRFVACPDVVGNAEETLRLFSVWHPVLAQIGLPVGLVAQDGQGSLPVPREKIDALFLGGSTEWKLGPEAACLAAEAKRRGLWLHLGRCNTRTRLAYAYRLGCDSVDGSSFSRWPDLRLPQALSWLSDLHGQPLPRPPGAEVSDFVPATRQRWGHLLSGLESWILLKVHTSPREVLLEVRYSRGPSHCPFCGSHPPRTRLHRHGSRLRQVTDLPVNGLRVRWRVRQQRYLCRACCRTFCQSLPGLEPGRTLTTRLASFLREQAGSVSARDLARCVGLDARTVRSLASSRRPVPLEKLVLTKLL